MAETLSKQELSEETFGLMAKWIRDNYYKTISYSDVKRWHRLYGNMESIPDLIRVLEGVSRGNFNIALDEWNRRQRLLAWMQDNRKNEDND